MVDFKKMSRQEDFKEDLKEVLNKHNIDDVSDTPDFMLAEYLVGCLETFERVIPKRDDWAR